MSTFPITSSTGYSGFPGSFTLVLSGELDEVMLPQAECNIPIETRMSTLRVKNILFIIIDSLRADKFHGDEKTSKTPNIDKLIKKSGDSDRAENWESILRLPIKNIFFGVGTGDELDEIQKLRNHKGWAWAYRNNANMHNQYLEVLLRNGILGLTIFLLVFII